MSQSLGEVIRERRLGHGLSLGQLATQASTTVAVVRAWERGESVPDDAVLSTLSDVLGLETAEVSELVAMADDPSEEPSEDESPTELISAASGVAVPSASSRSSLPASVEDSTRSADIDQLFASEEFDGVEDPPPEPDVERVAPVVAALSPDPEVPRPVPLRYPMSAPTGVAVEIAETEPNVWNPLRYLYDPEKPWLYWIRAGLTVVVLVILLNVLFNSIGERFDRVGEVIDSVEPSTGIVGTEPPP